MNQAVVLDIDWYDELEIVCKQILGRAMRRIDDFIRGELVYYGDKTYNGTFSAKFKSDYNGTIN